MSERLVLELLNALWSGGPEMHEAVLTLGLLIEREKVYRPVPGDDGGIKQILGEEFVNKRLSKRDLETAIHGLIEYIEKASVPYPGAIWALSKCYDPIILSPLIRLLDRYLADAEQEELAAQALTVITNFYGDQVLAVVQRAAEYGYGQVKEAARQYLARHHSQNWPGQEERSPHYIEMSDIAFPLDIEIYRLQRQPGQPHIVVNDGYNGILVLDPWTGTEVFRTPFTMEYNSAGIISDWCFRSDGKAVLVLHDESRTGALLSLEKPGHGHDVTPPPLRQIADIRYIWEDNSFWMTGGNSFAFFQLQWQEGNPIFVETAGIRARKTHTDWCRTLDRLSVLDSYVLRVEPDMRRMIYYDSSQSPKHIGVVSWSNESTWSVPALHYVPVMAFHNGQMFLMYEREVHVLNQQAQIEMIYRAPQGFAFCGIDILPLSESYPDALVLACNSFINPELSQILLYRLDTLQ
jgi:hypothetical protein